MRAALPLREYILYADMPKDTATRWQHICGLYHLTPDILVRPTEPNRGMSMTVSKTLVATAAVTLLMGVSTAQAQHRGGGGQSRGGGGGERATARAPSGPRSGGAPRAVAPRSYSNGPSRSGQARVY